MRQRIFLCLLWATVSASAHPRYLIDNVVDLQVFGSCPSDEIGRYPIASADINGDGLADLVIGQDNNISSSECLSAYVVLGSTDLAGGIDLQDGSL
jgi:hypothetical protein